jgi:sugar lactone lactonase YvrE
VIHPITRSRFAVGLFKRLSRIVCSSLMLLAIAAPLPAVDMLYVTMSDDTIVSFDTTSGVGYTIAASMNTFASANLSHPKGLAFDSSGNLYAANYSGSTISKFNASGGYVSNINSNLSFPFGLAFDNSGNLYAANNGDDTISKFNSSGAYISNITTNLNGPYGLAFDSSGNLYAPNIDNTISKFNSSGAYISNITTNLSGTFALAFDSSDNLYASNYYNSTISKFNPSGTFLSQINSNLNAPIGLAFDSSGNLYAANDGNSTISKFDSSGTFLTSWSTGGTGSPVFLAFKPVSVPEPSTYALAAIATGVMAAIARRHKARTVQLS